VSLRQRLADAVVEGNITEASTGALVLSFTAFVNADLSLPVAVIELRWAVDKVTNIDV